MKKIFLFSIGLFFMMHASAGWFICYVYKGMIGKDSVVLFLQMTPHYSDMENKDLPVHGVYINKKSNEPVSLEGFFYRINNKVQLIHRDQHGKQTQLIEFPFSSPALINGTWSDSNENKKVSLINTGSMIDTLYMDSTKPIDILMDTSLKDAYLVGIYSREVSGSNNSAKMDKLKVIDKKTGKLAQEIDLSDLDFECGNVFTILFKNVQLRDYNKDGYPDLLIWQKAGKMGSAFYALYDPKKKKFIVRTDLVTH